MKKTFFLVLILAGVFFSFNIFKMREVKNDSFQAGESYNYKVKYGIIPIGLADVEVHQKIFEVANRPCYRVNVFGRTSGITDLFKVRNTYRSFIDTTAILPLKFEYSAREGNYKRDQAYVFDHESNVVVKTEKDKKDTFKVPQYVQDMISGYYYLRTIDFAKMQVGQTVSAPLFFDKQIYYMKVKYVGKDVVKTRFGKIKVIKLNPILPDNELFKGEDAIRIWVSDDKNRVPIRLEADMYVASVNMEINGYSKVRNAFNWY